MYCTILFWQSHKHPILTENGSAAGSVSNHSGGRTQMEYIRGVQEYVRPDSLDELAKLISGTRSNETHTPDEASPHFIAGGTDLIIRQHQSKYPTPVYLISLSGIDELRGIHEYGDGSVFIGSVTPLSTLRESGIVKDWFPALSQAAASVGSPSIQNRATIGGNACNASPSADTALPLLAYDALARIWDRRQGISTIPITDFFTGPGSTVLQNGQVLTGFVLTKTPRVSRFSKIGVRRAMEIAVANFCISFSPGEGGVCNDLRIAVGAIAPTPLRSAKAEATLNGRKPTAALTEKAAAAAIEDIRPIDDVRGSAEYRSHIVYHNVRRLLNRMCGIAEARN